MVRPSLWVFAVLSTAPSSITPFFPATTTRYYTPEFLPSRYKLEAFWKILVFGS